jgi:sulfatase maturation enzyme AslB (radical SAM superfamily)
MTRYLTLDEVTYIQVDHNSTCNLRCPQCARTENGSTNPDLPLLELDINDYEKIITKNLKTIMFCGNYGDVSVSNTFFPVVDWLIKKSSFDGRIIVTTHGSARDESWWSALGATLKDRGKINFSIDGLNATNHLYRVNSNFDKIIKNARAFISAGGKARWDFLVFKHNEHQIDDAIDLARELGFDQFQIKLTNRFINDNHYRDKLSESSTSQDVVTKKSKYQIISPENVKLQGSGLLQNQKIIEKYGTWENYVNFTPISCKWKPTGQIFLDFESRIWPCTWVASGLYHYGNNTQKTQIKKILNKYGENFNSLNYHTFEEILNHRFFAVDFCQSWTSRMDDNDNPKLLCCGRTCGTDYEFSSAYGLNKMLINLS